MNIQANRFNLLALLTIFVSHYSCAENLNGIWKDFYLFENARRYEEAVIAINVILRYSPTNEFALLQRGWLNYRQGNYNDAIRDYGLALSINPRSQDARLGLTLPLMAQKRWREAAVEANKVIAVSKWDYTAHLRIMLCEEAEQKWADLSRRAFELSAHYPTDATALIYLGRAEAWLGNVNNAKSAYSKVLERFPAHAEALAYLANNP